MAFIKEREIRKLIEGEGGSVVNIQQRKHYVVTYQYGGHTHKITFAKSPSCHRWRNNMLAAMRANHRRKDDYA